MRKKKIYVVGTEVSTSMAPTIFQYWFNKYNINYAEYGYKEIKEENFDKEIKTIISAGTVIHKANIRAEELVTLSFGTKNLKYPY